MGQKYPIYDAYGTPYQPERLPDGIDIYFQLPLFDGFNTWDTKVAKEASIAHEVGDFWISGRMFWGMLSDPRVLDGLEKRGLALSEQQAKIAIRPGRGQRAKTLAKKYQEVRNRIWRPEVMKEMLDQAIMMGQAPAQPVWRYIEEGPDNPAAKATARKWFIPRVETWEPTLTRWIPGPWVPYWNVQVPQPWVSIQGQLTAITRGSERENWSVQVPIVPGSGQWVLFKLSGDRRPWMHGRLRAIWRPWIQRLLALLGWVRYNDVHGLPIRVVKVPMGMRRTKEVNDTYDQIKHLGRDAAVLFPQSQNGEFGVSMDLIEAKAESWRSFQAAQELQGREITILLTGGTQNAEAEGGNYKGAAEQMEIRHEVKAATVMAWCMMENEQMCEPFALLNGYDREEAPTVEADITPPLNLAADAKAKQEEAKALTEAIRAWWELRRGGGKVDLGVYLAGEGLKLPEETKYEEPTDPPPSTFPGAMPGDAAMDQTGQKQA